MSSAKMPGAYKSEYDIMSRGLLVEGGLEIRSREDSGRKRAAHVRHRLNLARAVDRKRNEKIFPEGDPRRGVSDFDSLQFLLREDAQGWYVLISNSGHQIEDLEITEVPPAREETENVVANRAAHLRPFPQKTSPAADEFD